MILIIADSLRWDRAQAYDMFEGSATWSRVRTPETFTAPCVSTILTGVRPENNGIRTWQDSPLTLPTIVDDGTLYSPVFTDGSDDSAIVEVSGPRTVKLTKYGDGEPEIWDWWEQETFGSSEFLVYHSFISHKPWGLGCRSADAEDLSPFEFINAGTDVCTQEYYDMGVVDMIERIREIDDRTDETIVVVGDHGEGLGERGVWDHGRERTYRGQSYTESVEKIPATTEVPLVVNRDDPLIPSELSLRDVRRICEYYREDLDEIPWDRSYPTVDDPVPHPRDRDDWGNDDLDDTVQDRLQDLGYL